MGEIGFVGTGETRGYPYLRVLGDVSVETKSTSKCNLHLFY